MRRGDAGLKIIFHLKDKKGHILNPSLTPLYLNTEFSCVHRYAKLFVPLYPLKERKYFWASKNPLYRLVVSYFIISWVFNYIMSGTVFVFVPHSD